MHSSGIDFFFWQRKGSVSYNLNALKIISTKEKKNVVKHLKGHRWHKGFIEAHFYFQRNIMYFLSECPLKSARVAVTKY